jgi:transcription-repair coupling factor (superfamily II helicase)
LNLAIGLRIPNEYIPEENQRLRMYKRIAGAEAEVSLADIRAELIDRYGPLTEPVENLIDAAMLRLECQRLGIAQVDRKRDFLQMRLTENPGIDPAALMQVVARNAKKGAQFTPEGILKFPLTATRPREILAAVHALLDQVSVAVT